MIKFDNLCKGYSIGSLQLCCFDTFFTIVNIKEWDWIRCRSIKLHNVSLTMG